MIPADELIAATGATEADTAALEALERGAVAFVQIQTDRYFGEPEEITEYINGNGSRRLWLRDHPIVDEYTAMTIVERSYPGGDPTTLEDGVFQLRESEREYQLVRFGDVGFWTDDYEYAVTYWRGYESGDEPPDIRQLVLDLVKIRWQLSGHEALRSETIGGYSYTRFGADDVEACGGGWSTINAWRRPVFA